MIAPHLLLGRRGEAVAARFLKTLGYKLLGKNVRVGRHDELDIVALDPNDKTLVFVEVKTRAKSDPDFGPASGFTYEKKRRLSRAIRRHIAKQEYEGGYRLDLLCVIGNRVTAHVKEIALIQ